MPSAAVVTGALRVNYFRVPKSGTVRQVSIVDILRQGQFFFLVLFIRKCFNIRVNGILEDFVS